MAEVTAARAVPPSVTATLAAATRPVAPLMLNPVVHRAMLIVSSSATAATESGSAGSAPTVSVKLAVAAW